MSEELQKLQKLGAQKIHEETHIPILHIQNILTNNFESFTKIQFIGFISIIEREYTYDLQELKSSGITYFDELEVVVNDASLFVIPKKAKSNKFLYIGIIAFVFVLVIIFQFSRPSEVKMEHKIDNKLIEDVKKSIKPKLTSVIDLNTTSEDNKTIETIPIVEEKIVKEKNIPSSFEIIAKSKVWFGYIDIDRNIKKQKTFKGKLQLDATKRWLLIFGHAYIDMYVNGEQQKFKTRNNVRFIYEYGKLRAINAKEFKRLNRGHKW